EKACDEEILQRLTPRVYLSSILQVVRFCIDSKVVGVSSITGSDLKRRIENIMSSPKQRTLTSWHVLSMSLLAVVLAVYCIATALFGNRAIAQSQTSAPSLFGSVYDASGAAIPGAMVVVSNGKTRDVVIADDAGQYKFAVLAEGTYTIEVSKLGFRWH